MRRSRTSGLALALLCLVLFVGCGDAAAPDAEPQTIRQAEGIVDAALATINWAVQDGWSVGARDILVGVHVDTAMAQRLFRVTRPAVGADSARVPLIRAQLDRGIPPLQRALDALWRLGGRDVLVFVQDTPATPPHYFRYPRQPKVTP